MDDNSRKFGSDFVEEVSRVIVPKHKFLSKNARFVHNLLRERGFIKNSWKDSLVRIASNCFFPHCSSCSCTQSQQTPPRPISTADISSLCVLPTCLSAQGAQKLVDKLNSGCQSDPSSGPSVPELPFSRPAPEDISLPGRGTPEESKREHWQPEVGPRSVRVPREGTQIPIQSRPEASLSQLRVGWTRSILEVRPGQVGHRSLEETEVGPGRECPDRGAPLPGGGAGLAAHMSPRTAGLAARTFPGTADPAARIFQSEQNSCLRVRVHTKFLLNQS